MFSARVWLRLAFIAAIVLQLGQGAPPAPTAPSSSDASPCLVKSISGDQITVLDGDNHVRQLRLRGVVGPASSPGNTTYTTFLEHLLLGEKVFVEVSQGASSVPELADVYRAPDRLHVNAEAVRQGYAGATPETRTDKGSSLGAHEERARAAEKGIWAPAARQPASSPTQPRAPTAEEPPRKQAQPESATVYVTKTGAKYHRAGCQYLRKSSIAIPLNEAKRGYSPCSKCGPPT